MVLAAVADVGKAEGLLELSNFGAADLALLQSNMPCVSLLPRLQRLQRFCGQGDGPLVPQAILTARQ